MHSIAILDYGSQYAQLIARRVREAHCYCELFPWDSPAERVLSIEPKGFILSGAPHSVYEVSAPFIPEYIFQSKLPILGICYGMQMLAHQLGGKVTAAAAREYGFAQIERIIPNPLLPFDHQQVWMSHGDRIEEVPQGFVVLARSQNSPIAAMGDLLVPITRVQYSS
jgi:GMP synthase (glutamine-hydrolysing)